MAVISGMLLLLQPEHPVVERKKKEEEEEEEEDAYDFASPTADKTGDNVFRFLMDNDIRNDEDLGRRKIEEKTRKGGHFQFDCDSAVCALRWLGPNATNPHFFQRYVHRNHAENGKTYCEVKCSRANFKARSRLGLGLSYVSDPVAGRKSDLNYVHRSRNDVSRNFNRDSNHILSASIYTVYVHLHINEIVSVREKHLIFLKRKQQRVEENMMEIRKTSTKKVAHLYRLMFFKQIFAGFDFRDISANRNETSGHGRKGKLENSQRNFPDIPDTRQHGKGELLSVGYSDIIKSSFRRRKLQRIRLDIFPLFVHVREQGFSSIRIFQLFDENKTRQPLFPSIFAEDENVKHPIDFSHDRRANSSRAAKWASEKSFEMAIAPEAKEDINQNETLK
ncbi:hypothetical protein V1477_007429 [Vespula maculifrons]|uniref:Uncharacterized protein n=1 Tax=Vespula maculifrons TaxID=7453 RepID=A0ABD2CIJ9_VESMC